MHPCYFISTRMGLYKEHDLAKSTECDMLHRTVKKRHLVANLQQSHYFSILFY